MKQAATPVQIAGGREILQSESFFKLTQDSVLLSDFANISGDERGLDLGAGIGCLGIMLLLRDEGTIDGIELNEGAARLAEENYARCGLSGRGTILTGNYCDLPTDRYQKYDMCISNPPYFSPKNGQVSSVPGLAMARSEVEGDISDLCRAASRALKTGGRFYVCYKPAALDELMAALRQNLLAVKRMRLVHHTPRKRAELVLIEARRDRSCELTVMPPLFILDEHGEQTAEYRRIYGDMSHLHLFTEIDGDER